MYEVLSEKNFTEKHGYEFIRDLLDKKYRPSLENISN